MEEEKFLKLMALSAGKYDAFLYDCDGTLADNMAAHTATYVAAAKEHDVIFDPAMIDELAGWPIADVVKEINLRYGSHLIPETFKARKAALYAAEYIDHIKPISYVVDHLKQSAGNVRIAVVSGGDREPIEKTLQILGISELVEVLVCAGDTPKGKPFPDPFLLAASQLGVDPSRCLVFEDGLPGVEAAKAAGMHWIRIDQLTFG